MYEEDPLAIDIATLSKLDPKTCVFEEEAAPYAAQTDENFDNLDFLVDKQVNLKKDMHKILE